MAEPFADRFAQAHASYGPLVVGADPHGEVIARWGLTDDADGLERFTDIVVAAARTPRPISGRTPRSRPTPSPSTRTSASARWGRSPHALLRPARACSS
jgi:hypothetical protein